MPVSQSSKYIFTFATSSTTSNIVRFDSTQSLQSLIIPASITGATFTVLGSVDSGPNPTMRALWNSGSSTVAAAIFTINYTASTIIRLSPQDFYGLQCLQLVSNMAQVAPVSIGTIVGVLT